MQPAWNGHRTSLLSISAAAVMTRGPSDRAEIASARAVRPIAVAPRLMNDIAQAPQAPRFTRDDQGVANMSIPPESCAKSIRQLLAEHGGLTTPIASLGDDDDLYRAGLTSHATINVMLALEGAFDMEFPERMLRRQTFESVSEIHRAVDQVLAPLSVH
jgi:acyl carrier protein